MTAFSCFNYLFNSICGNGALRQYIAFPTQNIKPRYSFGWLYCILLERNSIERQETWGDQCDQSMRETPEINVRYRCWREIGFHTVPFVDDA